MPALPLLLVTFWIGSFSVSAADDGPMELTMSVSSVVIVCGSPTSPTIDTSAMMAGKIDSTE